jgi:hypothetical protein
VPDGIPLGTCALTTAVTISNKENIAAFFIMRCKFIILTTKASRWGGLFKGIQLILKISNQSLRHKKKRPSNERRFCIFWDRRYETSCLSAVKNRKSLLLADFFCTVISSF